QADVSFGANVNGAGKTPVPALLFPPMNTISAPPAGDFSATSSNIGAGMSMASNYSVEMFTSAMGLYNANSPTNGTYYMADLTITFNLPITNPVLHIVGLGGTFGALGMTTSLQLVTVGPTLSELSGSSELTVMATTIANSSANPTSTTGAGAASGSVLVTGTVTSLQFKLFLRGNGKTPTWSNASSHTGDAWMMGISAMNTYVALPVGTTDFTAERQQHAVGLQWTTAIEQNSKYFAIQRSADGSDWSTIGEVAAAGNSDKALQYSFVDYQPLTGSNFYRLQQVDFAGASVYSPVRNVDFAGAGLMIDFYPNPVRDRLTITSAGTIQSVTLTTLSGQILQSTTGFTSGQSLDLSRYPFGIYFLIIRTSDSQTHVARIERI
ncbi:MAG TPA: T9SS type A sorting domain-containing protein, partial [Puia sp.]|nr:T9SS type A sorting domain-containing protein [Puia sp.]